MLHPGTLPLCRAFEDAGLTTWLIGGQAVELLCGGDVRPHDDIDVLVRLADAPAAVETLERLGFVQAHGSLEAGDVFYRRDDVLLDLVPIDDTGEPPCTLGNLRPCGGRQDSFLRSGSAREGPTRPGRAEQFVLKSNCPSPATPILEP